MPNQVYLVLKTGQLVCELFVKYCRGTLHALHFALCCLNSYVLSYRLVVVAHADAYIIIINNLLQASYFKYNQKIYIYKFYLVLLHFYFYI